MTPSAAPSASTACCSLGVTSWLVSAVVMSVASSRRSITEAVTPAPRSAASAVTRCAVRSASIRVDDGSDVPAVTTTRVSVSLIAFPSGSLSLVVRTSGGCTSFAHSSSSWRSSAGVSPAASAGQPERPCRRPIRCCTARPSAVSARRTPRPSLGSVVRLTRPRSASRSTIRDSAGWLSSTCRLSSVRRIGSGHLDSV